MKLNIYSISDDYINYLKQFDDKIYDNKETKRVHKRKYLGVVLTLNEFNYYIPMSSPKKSDYIDLQKKVIRKDTKTIIRMKEKDNLYGTLRISNMIPVPITELDPYIISDEKDLKYKDLVMGELRYINNNKDKIIKYAKVVYNQKNKNMNIPYIKNTVDFKLVETKLKEWDTKANNS